MSISNKAHKQKVVCSIHNSILAMVVHGATPLLPPTPHHFEANSITF